MEGYEDDDDTHFCNKCHSTVNGLENYVRHRQSGCRTTVDTKADEYHCSPPMPNVSYPEVLNADAFFSSLELQSSAKLQSRRATGIRLRRSGRHEARNKKRRKDKSPDYKDEGKEKLALLPGVTDLDDLGIPSLVGFPEIVATTTTASTNKPSTSTAMRSSKHASSGDSTSKMETSSYTAKQEEVVSEQKCHDDESQRMEQDHDHHSVWLEDTMLTDLAVNNENENKEHIRHSNLDRYAEYDLPDEDSDGDSLDVEMGEEDSYSDFDDDGHDGHGGHDGHKGHGAQYPPQGHTGGKWEPGGLASEEVHLHEDDMDMDERKYDVHPPPTYTGGKWKPSDPTIQKCDEYEKDSGQPPSGHTRGKWVPGARADINNGYWCSPCGRRLASGVLYNRHLQSDLHAKRSIQEIDGAVQMPRTALPLLHRQNLSKRQKVLASKKNSESDKSSTSTSASAVASCSGIDLNSRKKRLRRRLKEVLTCEMCHARVRRAQMGKHFLSHYHCRVAGAKPSDHRAQRFLLDNMANIVRQSPFQCAPCRFYCNTEDTFLRHWRSDSHMDVVSKIEGSFVCALCDFWCDDNESVEAHIMKQGHQDVVSMINGSVPIVIRRQRVLTCSTCCRQFRYNIQLRMHARESGHKIEYTASDEYQSRLACSICGQIVRSLIALQRHQLAYHNPDKSTETGTATTTTTAAAKRKATVGEPYFCSFCSMTFKTPREAVAHRWTSDHKDMVMRAKAGLYGRVDFSKRYCPHCDEAQDSLAAQRQHLLEQHMELCHRCPKCGQRFALSQELTWHTRDNRCTSDQEKASIDNLESSNQLKCDTCDFTSNTKAELLFHVTVTLHGEPAKLEFLQSAKNPRLKYECVVCKKLIRKTALHDHCRSHTGERPFPCGRCSAMFSRRSVARSHQLECRGSAGTSNCQANVAKKRERKYTCSECNSAFHTKFTVEVHLVHVNKKYKDLDEATHYPDGIAVVGILFKVDPNKSENPGMFMLSVLDAAISKVNSSVRTEIFDFSLFNFHEFNSFYTYSGSLTTPPCTENVRWIVLKEIFPISELSVKAYRRINLCDHEHFNIRPLQPINKRTVTLYTLKEKRLPNLCSKLFSNFQISLNRGKI